MNYEIPSVITIVTVAGAITWPASKRVRHVFCIPEGWAGLLYRHGLYVRRNNAGRHVVWGFGWTMNLVDLRQGSLFLADQQVRTADNVGLSLSLLVTYQVTNPALAAHETQDWRWNLSNSAALGLRAVAGGLAAEALLNSQIEIGAQLVTRLQSELARIGVSVLSVQVKDVVLPAGLSGPPVSESK